MGNQPSLMAQQGSQARVARECQDCAPTALQSATTSIYTAAAAAAHPYAYGRELATNLNASDTLGLRPKLEMASRLVDSWIDIGYLTYFEVGGVTCIGARPLKCVLKESERPARVVHSLPIADPGKMIKMPVLYKTKTIGSRVHIAKEEIPAFLLDNGVPLMDVKELEEHLKSKLSAVLPILECRCVARYSIKGKTLAGSLGADSMEGLKRGDMRFKIRIDEDFSTYTANPSVYEKKLKEYILEALSIDHCKAPGVKKHIKIEQVNKGSVEAVVVIGMVLLAVAVELWELWIGYHSHRDSNKSTGELSVVQDATDDPGSLGQDSASQQSFQDEDDEALGPHRRRRLLTHVSLSSSSTGSFEMVCHLHDSPKCYLPDTLFQLFEGGFRTAAELREGDEIKAIDDQKVSIRDKEVWYSKKRLLRTLRTAQAEITVTATHRVLVIENGERSERRAGDLKAGDIVQCGKRPQKLTRVIPSERDTEVVQFAFLPDDPVETFQAPQWSILTFGERQGPHAEVGTYGALGPHYVGEARQDATSSVRRPRSV